MDELGIREVAADEVTLASDLVRTVFANYVAPGYSAEGVATFLAYVEPAAILQRLAGQSFMLVALVRKRIVGVIEVRDGSHICLLFVDEAFHKQGIAKRLVKAALVRAKLLQCGPEKLTVHSSPYAVPVYERMNFCRSGPEEEKDGIRFVKMIRILH
ncbi:MAG TPA: GNAT family N-acetyltransferase [Negativicutes bacterium]|nr:GNAT family N-acetyltransferase [Negativicutes bacterium]